MKKMKEKRNGIFLKFKKNPVKFFCSFFQIAVAFCLPEILEELLEELIAFSISNIIALGFIRALEIGASLVITQTLKIIIVKAIKIVVKKTTYRKGNDKTDFLKNIFIKIKKEKFIFMENKEKKYPLKKNPKSLLATIFGVAMSFFGGIGTTFGVVDIVKMCGNINMLPLCGQIVISCVAGLSFMVLFILVFTGKIKWETVEEITERINKASKEKEAKELENIYREKIDKDLKEKEKAKYESIITKYRPQYEVEVKNGYSKGIGDWLVDKGLI